VIGLRHEEERIAACPDDHRWESEL
jgi:hypothetical protein